MQVSQLGETDRAGFGPAGLTAGGSRLKTLAYNYK